MKMNCNIIPNGRKKIMKFEEVMLLIRNLSKAQGFYGRMLRDIKELDVDGLEKFKEFIEEKNFKNDLEFILFIEGGE